MKPDDLCATPVCAGQAGSQQPAVKAISLLAQRLTAVGHSAATLNRVTPALPCSEEAPSTPAQRVKRVHRVPRSQVERYNSEYQTAYQWLEQHWTAGAGSPPVERLMTLLSRADVPPFLCQSVMHAMLKKIDKLTPPLQLDIKKAYIGTGIGTTPQLNQWIKQTWAATANKPLKQRILILLEQSPYADLMNVSTLHAILWHQLGDKAPSLGLMKRLSQRQWADHWQTPELINWVEQNWKIVSLTSQQRNIVALLREGGMPAGTSVSMLTAALARVLGNKSPGFDTVLRAFTQVRKEKEAAQQCQQPAQAVTQCCCLPAPRSSLHALSVAPPPADALNPPPAPPSAECELTPRQYYEALNDSELWARVATVLAQSFPPPGHAGMSAGQANHAQVIHSSLWSGDATLSAYRHADAAADGSATTQPVQPDMTDRFH